MPSPCPCPDAEGGSAAPRSRCPPTCNLYAELHVDAQDAIQQAVAPSDVPAWRVTCRAALDATYRNPVSLRLRWGATGDNRARLAVDRTAAALRKYTRVRSLDLHREPGDPRALMSKLAALAPAIAALTQLRHIDLAFVGHNAVRLLAPTLAALRTLTSVDLARNALCCEAGRRLALPPTLAALRQLTALTSLRLDLKGIVEEAALPPTLAALPALTSLDIGDFAGGDASKLAAALGPLTALTRLVVRLNARDVRALAPTFAALPALKELELRVGRLYGTNAEALVAALAPTTALTKLVVHTSGDRNARELALILATLPGETELVGRSSVICCIR